MDNLSFDEVRQMQAQEECKNMKKTNTSLDEVMSQKGATQSGELNNGCNCEIENVEEITDDIDFWDEDELIAFEESLELLQNEFITMLDSGKYTSFLNNQEIRDPIIKQRHDLLDMLQDKND